jgi:acetyltransferase-like isoleucine patch superfamily enzyme
LIFFIFKKNIKNIIIYIIGAERMKKILNSLVTNPLFQIISTTLVYGFYALVIGISLIPSLLLISWSVKNYLMTLNDILFHNLFNIAIFSFFIGASIYIYFITGLLFMGSLMRLIGIGLKEGRHSIGSLTFICWLIYSGIYTIILKTILPFNVMTFFSKIYYKIIGCKIGKNVYINTTRVHDAYLLELGNNVVIGAETDLSCHIFEGNHLILGKIKIGDNTLISSQVYIMPGVTIGKNCIIGIKSYIRKNKVIPDNSKIMTLAGLPIRQVAKLEKGEI